MQPVQSGILPECPPPLAGEHVLVRAGTAERLEWPRAALFVLAVCAILWFAIAQLLARLFA